LRTEYLVAENRILKSQIKGRLQLSDGERATLAEIAIKEECLSRLILLGESTLRKAVTNFVDHLVADLIGKGGHVRTVPVPTWVKLAVDNWLTAAGISTGPVFRAINKARRIAPSGFSPKVIWGVVKAASSKCGLDRVAPHDLRRTCARLCHEAGGELEQIQFLPGHVSVQTTERYLGCKQRLRNAVNDKIGLEPAES